MMTIREYARPATLEEAWQLNQKKPNRVLGPESTGRPLHPAHEQCGDGHSQCTVGRELL